MRYNFLPSLWILVYVIFAWPYKRFNCNDICKNPEIVIIENDTYRYSLHYYYSMRIQRYQSEAVPSDRFKNMIDYKFDRRLQFSFSFYGSHAKEIYFHKNFQPILHIFGWSYIRNIHNYIKKYTKIETGVLDEVPKEIEGSQLKSEIFGQFSCKGVITEDEIPVPAKWIKSGTLVEFEAIGEICSQYNTSETCQNATTANMTCIWCEKGNACIESNNQNTHGLKVNDCRVEIEFGCIRFE
uniref:Egg protein CP391S-like protein n=1 Tax=Schistosoma mansoni TaxID=6183 RepID=A0AA82N8K8_SCHMA